MTAPRFLQVHTLTSYPAVLLNRDDTGSAKRLPYGGVSRTRISSQSLKRHWRKAEDEWQLDRIGAPMADRSREALERQIMPSVQGPPDIVEAVRVALAKRLYGDKSVEVKSRQALLLGRSEVTFLAKIAQDAITAAATAKGAEAALDARFGKGPGKQNLASLRDSGKLNAGLESALFGRMVTSDPEANTDAAIHVAHAFTVHAEESESDYFTVVDDLTQAAGESGAGGIFETELTSGLFYGYVVVDIPGLTANLGSDPALAAKVVEHLLHLVATVSPGAKKGSTAPYAYAELMLLELGNRQPRSLAGAFRAPVRADGDLLASALAALGQHMTQFDAAYGAKEERAALCRAAASLPGVLPPMPLDALAQWAAAAVGRE